MWPYNKLKKILFAFLLLPLNAFNQNVSFESYVILPANTSSFTNNEIISFSTDYSKIYLGVSHDTYSGTLQLAHGAGSSNNYEVFEFSETGTLLTEINENLFHLGQEGMHYRISSLSDNSALGFYTLPSGSTEMVSDLRVTSPCSQMGVLKCDINSQTSSQLTLEDCISFNHFYSGFIDHGFGYSIYNDNSGDYIKKWGINPLSEFSSYPIYGLESLPYVNLNEGMVYFLSEIELVNNEISGKVKSINYQGITQDEKSFSTEISNPRIIGNNQNTFLIQAYVKDFKIERVNANGQTDKVVTLEKEYQRSKTLPNGNILVLTHDETNENEPLKLYLLNQNLEIIGAIGFGVSYAYPISMKLGQNSSEVYISGIVNTSHLSNSEDRKRNASMLVKITFSDLINSNEIQNKIEYEIKLE